MIRKLLTTFARPERIVEDYDLASARGLSNDVLIALSARAIGAVVVTQNDRHFAAINRVRPFKLSIVRPEPPRPST